MNAEEWALIGLTPELVASANGGKGAVVAVLDGLADCRHADLRNRCSNVRLSGGRYYYYDRHGTHVAGIVAGAKTGVAPAASIINHAVFDDRGYYATGSKLIAAISAAANAGATIANMSFGCPKSAFCSSPDELRAMADANLKMLYVKAAGNDGVNLNMESSSVTYEVGAAALARTILVGSVDVSGTISSFSNRPGSACLLTSGATACTADLQWKYYFIVAPGRDIHSTLPGASYGYMSGTSMAAPVVAGAAALLQARWPTLKSSPETVAKIFFNSATDLGAPGVDEVYGWGLLNVARAFQAAGTVTIVGPSGTTTTMTGTTSTTSPTYARFAQALGPVTVYDIYGRDYALAETNALQVRSSLLGARQLLGRRLLGLGGQAEWAEPFFTSEYSPRGYAMFHSPAESDGGAFHDRSLRMGLDMPFKGGVAQMRLTGASGSRLELAHDPTLRPLSFFASTALIKSSVLAHALVNLGPNRRLSVYGTATTRTISAALPDDPLMQRLAERRSTTRLALAGTPIEQSQHGIGLGYWARPDNRTIIGLNASFVSQKGGYYDLVSNLAAFQKPTRMLNLGVAASRAIGGSWEVTGSGEVTHLRMSAAAEPLAFTPSNLVSAEVGIRKSAVVFAGAGLEDSFSLALAVPPRAVSGSLRVDHMTRTPDGLGRQAATYEFPLTRIGANPLKVEAAYRLTSSDAWSVDFSGGLNLRRNEFGGAGEVFANFRMAL